ncbi:MAG: YbaK/EbsC family protein [Haloechinothrix sp.]
MTTWSVAGTLRVVPVADRPDLLADVVAQALKEHDPDATVGVAEIDPELADTAAFCAAYSAPLAASANCVVVAGKRAGEVRYAAALVLATTRADVNGVIKRRLDVRKASFAAVDDAVQRTGMAFGGITPIGLPTGWPILIDAAVAAAPELVIGSGVRGSKLLVSGSFLTRLPGAEVIDRLAQQD